jgi:hypothetical protein
MPLVQFGCEGSGLNFLDSSNSPLLNFTHSHLPFLYICSYKYAEVLSADCYEAFEEAGLDDDAYTVVSIGRKFR